MSIQITTCNHAVDLRTGHCYLCIRELAEGAFQASVTQVPDPRDQRIAELEQTIVGLRRWQDAALSWLRADTSPSALAMRRDADDPTLAYAAMEKQP